MDRREALKQIASAIREAGKVFITTHIKVDGDGLGSELALKRALALTGVEVRVINDTPVPQALQFMLDHPGEIELFDEERDAGFIAGADLIMVLDVALLYRLGGIRAHFEKSGARKVCVDHHLEGDDKFDIKLSEPGATSTGELVFHLIKELGTGFTPSIARALYTSIIVDSGCLSYERCVPETYRIISELVENGADPYDTHLSLHWKKSLEQLKIEGEVIDKLQVDGEIAYSVVSRETAGKYRQDPMEMPELVHIPLALESAEIALLFIENGGNEIKVSARSKGKVKVCRLAKQFGGGGHSLAAGFVVDGPLPAAIEKVLGAAREFLRSN